eukprot:8662349-Pyramimonas_sp.AAC.1
MYDKQPRCGCEASMGQLLQSTVRWKERVVPHALHAKVEGLDGRAVCQHHPKVGAMDGTEILDVSQPHQNTLNGVHQ